MKGRELLRIALVTVVLAVGGLVVWQWRQPPSGEGRMEAPPPPTAEGEEATEVQSRSKGLEFTQTVNGRPRYRLRAREHLGFQDGRNAWRGGVSLVLYPDDGDPVRVTGDEMTTAGPSDQAPKQVEVSGAVAVELPSGGTIDTERLLYRSAARLVVSRAPVELHIGGLRVRARRMEYDTAAARLVVEDALELEGLLAADGTPRMRGSARALVSGDERSRLHLRGPATVRIGAARIDADEMIVVLDEESSVLRSLEAKGQASARWLSGAPGSPAERPASDDPSASTPRIESREIVVELPDAEEPLVVTAATVEDRRPRMRAGAAGEFVAERIELTDDAAAGERRLEAGGEARWRPQDGGFDFDSLAASMLTAILGGDGLERLGAVGGVEAALRNPADGAAGRVAGEEFRLRIRDGEVAEAVWPEGFRYEAGELRLAGASARLEPDEGLWRVEGDPTVHAESDSYEVTAPRMGISSGGTLEADGDVKALLREGGAGTMAVLFTGAEAVQVQAETLTTGGEDTLEFGGGVRAWQGDQALVAERLTVSPGGAFVRAEGDLLLTVRPAVSSASGAELAGDGSPEEPRSGARESTGDEAEGSGSAPDETMRLVGDRLLVEGAPPTIRLAGDAELRQGERRMRAGTLTVEVDEKDRSWRAVELVGDVELEDPAGTAVGTELLYDLGSDEMVVSGTPRKPAVFTDSGGVRTESQEALNLRWRETEVLIAAREQGRTRTVLVSRPDTDG